MFTATCVALVLSTPGVGFAEPEPAEAVQAREKGVRWLVTNATNGTWSARKLGMDVEKVRVGVNALATAALLEAGASPTTSPVSDALSRLATAEPGYTYSVALQTVALARADPKKYAGKLKANADWLARTAVRTNGRLAGWSYPIDQVGRSDGSNTQFAVLALSVAADAGVKVDPKLWEEIRDMYVRTRKPGGWTYAEQAGLKPTQPMTAAALCGLYLADRHLGRADEAATAARKAALDDWAKRYGEEDGPSVFYQWYGTARLGRLVGKPVIPGPGGREVNWYRDGLAWLTKHQHRVGYWGQPGVGKGLGDNDDIIATSFALLFLGPRSGKP